MYFSSWRELGFFGVRKVTEKNRRENRKTGFPRKIQIRKNRRKRIKLRKTIKIFYLADWTNLAD